jgi:predicted HicB family RNase H-like nuclease
MNPAISRCSVFHSIHSAKKQDNVLLDTNLLSVNSLRGCMPRDKRDSRLTVRIKSELKKRLEAEAIRQKRSKADLVERKFYRRQNEGFGMAHD